MFDKWVLFVKKYWISYLDWFNGLDTDVQIAAVMFAIAILVIAVKFCVIVESEIKRGRK